MRTTAALLALVVALSGCGAPASRTADPDPDEERVRETIEISNREPDVWSPVVTIPLYPVLFVTHNAIELAKSTYRYFAALFGGSDEPDPVPERIEKQAEKLPKN